MYRIATDEKTPDVGWSGVDVVTEMPASQEIKRYFSNDKTPCGI
jgi:hypothetical protein